jgi:hypothetical protein
VDNGDAGRTGPLRQLGRLILGGSDPSERHDPPDIGVLAVDHDEGGVGQARRGQRQAAEGSQVVGSDMIGPLGAARRYGQCTPLVVGSG